MVALAFAVWGGTLGHGFVWDDQYFVVQNPALRSWSYLPAYFYDVNTMAGCGMARDFALFRPVRNISYLIDFTVVGLEPRWWHAHNILLHALNAFLVFLLARRLLPGSWTPLLAAALFLVHPVQSEVVAWVKSRDDLLMTFFILVAVLLWMDFRKEPLRRGRLFLLAAFYMLACLSKIQAIILPLLLAAFEAWIGPKRDVDSPNAGAGKWRALGILLLFGVACLAWRHVVIGRTSQSGYMGGTIAATWLTMVRVAADYLRLMFVPVNLVADYSAMEPSRSLADPRVLISGAVVLAAAGWVFLARRRQPVATFGLLWAAICLLPVSNVVAMLQFMAERFLYLPLAGFALLAGAAFRRIEYCLPSAAVALAVLVVALFGALAADRAALWKSSETLYAATVRDTPEKAVRPRRNLLAYYVNARRFTEAKALAEKLLAQSDAEPSTPAHEKAEYHRHLGWILLEEGQKEKGLDCIRAAIALDPEYAEPYADLGWVEAVAGNDKGALEWYAKAAERASYDVFALYNYGIALQKTNRPAEAEAAFQKAIALAPADPTVHKSLAALLWSEGRIADAAGVYQAGLRIWPRDAEMRQWLQQAKAGGQ